MGKIFDQTADATACGIVSGCGGRPVSPTAPNIESQLQPTGSAGGEQTFGITDTDGIAICVVMQTLAGQPNARKWYRGDYTARLNVTTGSGFVNWEEVSVCRATDPGCNFTLVGTSKLILVNMFAGIKTHTFLLPESVGAKTDTLFLAYAFSTPISKFPTVGITFNQKIDTPIEEARPSRLVRRWFHGGPAIRVRRA